jgi:hypothetical protein
MAMRAVYLALGAREVLAKLDALPTREVLSNGFRRVRGNCSHPPTGSRWTWLGATRLATEALPIAVPSEDRQLCPRPPRVKGLRLIHGGLASNACRPPARGPAELRHGKELAVRPNNAIGPDDA